MYRTFILLSGQIKVNLALMMKLISKTGMFLLVAQVGNEEFKESWILQRTTSW